MHRTLTPSHSTQHVKGAVVNSTSAQWVRALV